MARDANVTRTELDKALGKGESAGTEWVYQCPRCPDHKGAKLHANTRKQVFVCFRCEWRGRLRELADAVGIVRRSVQTPVDKLLDDIDGRADEKKAAQRKPKRAPTKLVDGLRYLGEQQSNASDDPEASLAWHYVVNVRGVEPRTVMQARLAVHSDWPWRGYVLFPVFSAVHRGEVVYVSGRAYVDGKLPQRNPRSCELPLDRGEAIYGYERMSLPGWGVVCEAPLDALRVAPFAGATYGTQVTDEQVAALAALKLRRLVIMFDREPDAQRKAWALAARLSAAYPHGTAVALPRANDPGGQDRATNLACVSAATPYSDGAHAYALACLAGGLFPGHEESINVLDVPDASGYVSGRSGEHPVGRVNTPR